MLAAARDGARVEASRYAGGFEGEEWVGAWCCRGSSSRGAKRRGDPVPSLRLWIASLRSQWREVAACGSVAFWRRVGKADIAGGLALILSVIRLLMNSVDQLERT